MKWVAQSSGAIPARMKFRSSVRLECRKKAVRGFIGTQGQSSFPDRSIAGIPDRRPAWTGSRHAVRDTVDAIRGGKVVGDRLPTCISRTCKAAACRSTTRSWPVPARHAPTARTRPAPTRSSVRSRTMAASRRPCCQVPAVPRSMRRRPLLHAARPARRRPSPWRALRPRSVAEHRTGVPQRIRALMWRAWCEAHRR